MISFLRIAFVILTLGSLVPGVAQAQDIDAPKLVLYGIPFDVTISALPDAPTPEGALRVDIAGQVTPVDMIDGSAVVTGLIERGASTSIVLLDHNGAVLSVADLSAIPGWLSLLPALVAIGFALLSRQVIPSLFFGLWVGSALIYGLYASSIWFGLMDVVPVHVLGGLNDSGHLSVLLFTLLIGGMVGIISKNGGTAGIVHSAVRIANTPRKGQVATGGLGLAVFFDDYANTMIVGTTMRPVTDRLRISREKLAYLVDSTAASVATLALVTTWIGFVVSIIAESLSTMDGFEGSGYGVFLNSIPFSFYPILALVFVFVVAFSGRDFGPMLQAERRARLGDPNSDASLVNAGADTARTETENARPKRAINAVLPILVLVAGTFGGLFVTGRAAVGPGAGLHEIVGEGDPFVAMIWASLLAVLCAAGLSIGQRILSLEETVEAWFDGARAMFLTVIILALAWALADLNGVLGTGPYLTSLLGERVSPAVIPLVAFILSAGTAFATGSSWGVMGIVMPLAVPLVWSTMQVHGLGEQEYHIVYATVAAVIGGAVWGDHCSPISDTTILSSLASGCNHMDHVRTQLPYAGLVGVVAVVALYASSGFALPWWICLLVSTAGLVAFIYLFGRPVDLAPETAREKSCAQAALADRN
ncbi:MAG: Na+/H+ antiporter NhaC family protein [Pseudomonadota bacterium]